MPDLKRRDFLKLVGVSAGGAAAAGCSDHVEKLIPYVVQPEEITPGIAVHYASTCMECSAACGLHVRTREARPVKHEANPDPPINRGALCARGQASIGRTFHPDRFRGPMARGADSLNVATASGIALHHVARCHAGRSDNENAS
jgi:anaerobic selenocysteine-containing dehydrogenase